MKPLAEWKTVQAIHYSWQIIREDKVFLAFPVLSGFFMVLATALTLGLLYENGFFGRIDIDIAGITADRLVQSSVSGATTFDVVVAVLGYLITVFVAIYFQAAMYAAAMQRLRGGRPRFFGALGQVNRCLPELIGWTCFSSTIGLLLQYLVSSQDLVAKIPGLLLSVVWAFTTYFVVPLLVLERMTPAGAVKRSTGLLRATWGKQLKGQVGFGLAYFAVLLPFCLAHGVGAATWSVVGLVLVLLYLPMFLAAFAALHAMDGVFQTALFRFATTGEVGSDYPETFIRGAYKSKMPPNPLPALPNRPGTADWTSSAWPVEAADAQWPARPRLGALRTAGLEDYRHA